MARISIAPRCLLLMNLVLGRINFLRTCAGHWLFKSERWSIHCNR